MLNIVQLVLESLIALSLVVLIIPSFGNFFIGFTKLKFSTAAEYVLSWMLGISLISFFSFVTALFLGPVAFQVIGWLSVIVLSYKRNYAFQTVIKLFSHLKKNLVMSLFVFFAALITAGTLMGSWIPLKDGIYIQDGQQQDSLWHIALTKQLLLSVPPVHPSSFTTSVHNYHYFYNILIAVFATTFHIQITTLYYQVFPLIICLLLAVTGAVYAGYPQKKATAFWTVFLTFFCGSFAYLIPVFLPGQQWHDSSFWVSQTFSMMVNPQLLLSYSGVLAVLLVYKVRKKTDNKLLLTLLITGIAAPLIGIKAYAWIFALSAAGLYTLSDLIVDKKRLQTILLGLLTLVICVGVYLVCMGMPKEGAFTFLPLWYLSSMMESPDRLNLPYWRILEDHYRAHHNWLRVAEIQLKELFYFVFGNLGLRSILVAAPVVALVQFVRTKKISFNPHTTILFILLIESMTLPLLVIQKNGPVWNSIQFFYYGLIFGNVLAAGVLAHLFSKIRVRWAQVLCGAVCMAAALPTFITSVPYKYRNYYRIPTATIALLQKNILPTEQIVICPDARAIYDTSLVSALTGARPLLAHPVQIDLMYGETITKERESEIKRLFSSVDQIQSAELKQFMADKKIRTALCSKKNNSIAADSLVLFQPSVVQ